MSRLQKLSILVVAFLPGLIAGQELDRGPVIDVHLHAVNTSELSTAPPNPVTGSAAPREQQQHITQTIELMKRERIVLGVVSGGVSEVEQYRRSAPDRILPALQFPPPLLPVSELRPLFRDGRLRVLGEVMAIYQGMAPSDPKLDVYWSLAQELDIPVAIHTGRSWPGVTRTFPAFRAAFGRPLLVEEILNRYPRLRVYLMHAGSPFLDEVLAVLGTYPNVYVDIGALCWQADVPRQQFYSYLEALIRAGYGDRIMFGSDQIYWPDAIPLAVDAIKKAPFLSRAQKRDILYNNAARFLGLTPEQIAAHHKVARE